MGPLGHARTSIYHSTRDHEQMADAMPNLPCIILCKTELSLLMIYDYQVIATLSPTELLRNKYKIPLEERKCSSFFLGLPML